MSPNDLMYKNRLWFILTIMSWVLIKLYTKHVMNRGWKQFAKFLLSITLIFTIVDLTGLLRHVFETDFSSFSYPLELENFSETVSKFRNGEKTAVKPLDNYYSNISFLSSPHENCDGESYRLVIVVKSAGRNFKKRAAIRASWGNTKRFSDVPIKTVFILGRVDSPLEMTNELDGKLRPVEYTIRAEAAKYSDIIWGDFEDSYYNNTLKTLLSLRWLSTHCSSFSFSLFVDDDMYVSLKNLLKFLRNPTEYGQNIGKNSGKNGDKNRSESEEFDVELSGDVRLYAGNVFNVTPLRHRWSKWFVSLSQYPFDYYPPYVPAGAIVMSRETVLDIYYASFFTQLFVFDDVYIGIIAKKLNLVPFHSQWFEYYKLWRGRNSNHPDYKYLITSHDYSPEEIIEVWTAQKFNGNA